MSARAEEPTPATKSPKEIFSEIMWKKFVTERDPRLADLDVSEEEMEDFAANLSREPDGERISLTLTELSGLVRPKTKECAPETKTWGLDLDQGPVW